MGMKRGRQTKGNFGKYSFSYLENLADDCKRIVKTKNSEIIKDHF